MTSVTRRLVLAALAGPALAPAQSDWARVAVPSYSPAHLVRGLHRDWIAPRGDDFARDSQALVASLDGLCEAPAAAAPERLRAVQAQWRAAVRAWELLSAVALGPVIERRSMRSIDFAPTRPQLIERAIAAAPRGAEAMERIGTPAKGLPALEWLLWTRPAAPGSPACAYAREVAADVHREAAALQAAYRALAEREAGGSTDEAAVAAMAEFVNQWVGGLERLRWPGIEKPLRAKRPEELPRAASGNTPASWAASWQALRSLAVFAGRAAPAPGEGLVPIETYLRGRGANPLADRLVQQVRRVDAAMKGLAPSAPARALAAARELAALKQLAEDSLAPALEVSIGFSDADGD